MALPPELTEEERAGLAKSGFKADTAYMEVPRCDSCRWWRNRQCTRQEGPDALFYVPPQRGYSWAGVFSTEPNFGCVQWEPKE